MRRFFLLGFLQILLGSSGDVFAQTIARLTLHDVNTGTGTPVYIDLDALSSEADDSLVLQQVVGNKKIPVAFQVEHGYHRSLWWLVRAEGAALHQTQVFELSKGKQASTGNSPIEVTDKDGALL